MTMPFSAHALCDIAAVLAATIGYFIAGRIINRHERAMGQNLAIVAGALIAGSFCARLVVPFEHGWPVSLDALGDGIRAGGKSIAGGFFGGIAGVKLVKLFLPAASFSSIDRAIGDQVIVPFSLAVIIGRIGCLLTGLHDNTHGAPTALPWGIDYGDAVARHPTQLYEIAAILVLTGTLLLFWKRLDRYGLRFRLFMAGFFLQRFLIEFVGVHARAYGGLTVYQVICLAGIAWSFVLYKRAPAREGGAT
jgi:phosphatidylglycerol:prolipoprotein diacylglycerol transferase